MGTGPAVAAAIRVRIQLLPFGAGTGFDGSFVILGFPCVEARRIGHTAEVRDSKDPAGPVLAFGRQAWSAFVVSLGQNRGG